MNDKQSYESSSNGIQRVEVSALLYMTQANTKQSNLIYGHCLNAMKNLAYLHTPRIYKKIFWQGGVLI